MAESAGLIRSEVLAIEVNSYNQKEGLLTINGRIIVSDKCRYIKEKHVHTRTRTIKLPDVAIEALNSELEKREAKIIAAGESWNKESNYIFTDNLGNHLTVDTLSRDISKIKVLSGIKNFDIRNLRKNTIHMMMVNNIPVSQVSAYLGIKNEYILPLPYKKTNISEADWRESIV